MSESVTVTNFPDSGSAERVAYDLTKMIIHSMPSNSDRFSKENILDTYADCLKVVRASGYKLSELR